MAFFNLGRVKLSLSFQSIAPPPPHTHCDMHHCLWRLYCCHSKSVTRPIHWPSGSALKSGCREVLDSIPNRACRLNLSEFSVVFLRNSRKYVLGSHRKTFTEGIHPIGPGLICGQFALFLQLNPLFYLKNEIN